MMKIIARVVGMSVSIVGLYLLARVVLGTISGYHAAELFPASPRSWLLDAGAVALRIPVPLHVISVGLVLQKRWLPSVWDRLSFIAVTVSGCWLGLSLLVRLVL